MLDGMKIIYIEREKEKGHCHILFAHEISNNRSSKLRIVCVLK